MAVELGCYYRDFGFNPEPKSVLVPDPSQDDRFNQEDVWYLIHTTFVLLQDVWGSRLVDQQ